MYVSHYRANPDLLISTKTSSTQYMNVVETTLSKHSDRVMCRMKPDFLRDCLSETTAKARQAIPLDEFQREFCQYCQNVECARSGASNMAFVRRAQHWHSDMFTSVPRASEADPRYDAVRSKWYKPPRVELVSGEPAPAADTVPVQPGPPAEPQPAAMPSAQPIVPSRPQPNQANTPFDQPAYVGEKPADQVLPSGGTFVFGG